MRAFPLVLAAGLVAGAAAAAPADRLCRSYDGLPENEAGPRAGMVWTPGGVFTMGDDDERPEERRAHRVAVSGFWIDRHEVTNAQFARFVAATGHRTVAERGTDPALRPGPSPDLPPELLRPGSMVFSPPERAADLAEPGRWWRYVPGASWREPEGPGSSIAGRENHPVVHVAREDALAYARWLGRDLPTEAQWEFAARGGLEGATYAWGDAYHDPVEGWRANTWQGPFPARDEGEDGFRGAAPVGCFAPNGHGLFDMTGNVWEHVRDWYAPGHPAEPAADPAGPGAPVGAEHAARSVIKGGSWLCAPGFCARYRPSARQPQEQGLGASHVGFRTVLEAPGPEVTR